MKKIDSDGLLLCELQAKTFEKSLKETKTSSEIFIRRFMNGRVTKEIDSGELLDTNLGPLDILASLEEQYGISDYGSAQYSADELYWIGYFYRYYCYTYEISSLQAFKRIKPRNLREVYLPYHTLDLSQAVERVLEAEGLPINEEEELQRQYQIFKKIREIKSHPKAYRP